MESKIMSINLSRKRGSAAGFTLVEIMVSSAVTSLLFLVLGSFSLFSSRSYTAVANYSIIESQSRLALDQMSQQIRQCRGLTDYSTNRVTVLDVDGELLTFAHDQAAKTLSRIKGGQSKVLLSGCDYLKFDIFQRTPKANSFEAFPARSIFTAKMVQVTWLMSRRMLGASHNSDVVQSAKIVIRKKPD
jgi:hypothetical protein